MKLRYLLIAVAGLAVSGIAIAQPVLVLDCPVSKANPIFDLADFPEGAAAVKLERYRFAIPVEGGAALATTPRASGIPAQVVQTNTHFQIDIENKRVVIDRMTAEFQVAIVGAQYPLGGGACMKLEQRKF